MGTVLQSDIIGTGFSRCLIWDESHGKGQDRGAHGVIGRRSPPSSGDVHRAGNGAIIRIFPSIPFGLAVNRPHCSGSDTTQLLPDVAGSVPEDHNTFSLPSIVICRGEVTAQPMRKEKVGAKLYCLNENRWFFC